MAPTGEHQTLLPSNDGPLAADIKNLDGDVSIPVGRPLRSITPSQRRTGYSLVALAAVAQAMRATGLHAILSRYPIPLSLSFLAMAIVFNTLSAIGLWNQKINPLSLLNDRSMFTVWCFRAVSSSIMKYLNFVTLRSVAVGTSLTIFASSPSMASVFAFLFLGDRITWADIGILIVNIIGVFCVTSPWAHTAQVSGDPAADAAEAALVQIGIMAAIGCAIFQAATTNMEKFMSAGIPVVLVLLSIGAGSTLAFLILIRWDHFHLILVYPVQMVGLLIVALLTFITHGLLNYSMKFCRPGLVLVVRSLSVPISFFLGYVFLFEFPSLLEMFGAALILASLCFIGFS